jgi:uncharacterized RDD family membrane protein YckC
MQVVIIDSFLQRLIRGSTVHAMTGDVHVTGIRVVTDTGGKAGFGRIFGRTMLRPLDAFGGYLLAWLVAVFSVRRQRIGDHAVGTLVVRV